MLNLEAMVELGVWGVWRRWRFGTEQRGHLILTLFFSVLFLMKPTKIVLIVPYADGWKRFERLLGSLLLCYVAGAGRD